ncbi:adenosylcobinamide-GDP ribazoletransferase [Thalassotalea sp. SU-HH00458]|uniref:adenosylcobinamide-GDP ribazoletransferase n=1 Tax=Thalassotalea sp. SU-HH00458 TaxID=3127657 RepID=UPI0033656201
MSKRYLVKIRYQWQLFCLALMFFSQLPVSKSLPYSEKRMNRANRYFSLVGIVIGLLVCLSYSLFDHFFSTHLVIILTMITSVYITGAFHEDGLADMADGMGGGYSAEKRLTIMKDSRIGTYGTVTLVLSLLLKFQLLVELEQHSILMISVVFAYAMSRAFAASLIFDTPYVAEDDSSKSKPIACQQSGIDLMILLAVAFLPALLFPWFFVGFWSLLLSIIVILLLLRLAFRYWLISKIAGYTGDCLGAAQQVSELIIYLVLIHHISNTGVF